MLMGGSSSRYGSASDFGKRSRLGRFFAQAHQPEQLLEPLVQCGEASRGQVRERLLQHAAQRLGRLAQRGLAFRREKELHAALIGRAAAPLDQAQLL
jgi:hypothetical protein